MLNRLESMPVGLVQLEAGIQSVHPETLSAVERPWSIDKAFAALQKLISFENIHVHVDLIAGLPHEIIQVSWNPLTGYGHSASISAGF